VLLAAALLRIPARRIRALALGDEGTLRDWIANESATRLAEARRDARLALARLDALGARVVALGTSAYPAGLRELRDPPPFLCVRGALAPAPWRAGTAIVGTREPSPQAAAFAFALAGRVAAPIVSGLARGIDAAAHEGALAAGVPTLAYVGNGIGATYPAEHRDLEERIVAGGGAVLSELLPDEPVSRFALVRRDRLQAAHAAAVVLVQSDADGGAMHALRAAAALGRPRFALASTGDDQERGNARAIADGALALTWNIESASRTISGQPPPPADHTEPTIQHVENPFPPLELARASAAVDIDDLPFGVIVVDRKGTILEYNRYESELTGFKRERVIGRNFFHDVAPCTALKEFEGRFEEFLSSHETSIEPFEFVFKFSKGEQRVSIVFVRLNFDSERATICVARRP
jgi:DNA processing protein